MIKIINTLDENGSVEKEIETLLNRSQLEFGEVNKSVEDIVLNVRDNKDSAVLEYTEKFDGVRLESLLVTEKEIEEAYNDCDKELIEALEEAKQNIWDYHSKQLNNSWIDNSKKGIMLGQVYNPIEKVGIYVPGGTAPYPSTVLMNAVPAKVAGVEEIVMVTPPGKDGKVNKHILASAKIAGVDKIFKVGGAQGIAALAFGTETIPKVYKIVGPGNIYVAIAKRLVYGYVDIDMIAGPSEILVIADETANPEYVAADLLSQAEHDTLASSILVTTSAEIAEQVKEELRKQTEVLSRKDIIEKSLKDFGAIIVAKDLEEAIKLSNAIAPEHLELMVQNPFEIISEIKNAGAIFLGQYSPEPLGDYFAGPNHTLPTSSTAKFYSPLSTDDFVKKSSLIYYNRENLEKNKDKIIKIAESEGLTAHANSIRVRFK
ncbi:histidinol dehydrogenase HisD [Gottschalkia acidurici 9a]|uniref:Histidinol dehydrogenase n=1 Tax=Gottschalkia acidurici (strain ATCC 7906 / DSM 604 / BCRC 14475 / CIP 104303 / KCTC 5404 / NCIMB 10678 / 9a) TaxID=1128398 RepID=K0AZR0_GOTA9|nr:histidinol dehydrogenase [Gottschalkia acidurici]AFS78764.1 histidinol dehydrogenase HisD [Gottschalkia acidurici 9a]